MNIVTMVTKMKANCSLKNRLTYPLIPPSLKNFSFLPTKVYSQSSVVCLGPAFAASTWEEDKSCNSCSKLNTYLKLLITVSIYATYNFILYAALRIAKPSNKDYFVNFNKILVELSKVLRAFRFKPKIRHEHLTWNHY